MSKTLFLIHDLGVGGAEKVLVSLVNHMDREQFDITVISLFGGGVNEQFLAPHIHYRAVWPKAIPGNSKLLKLLTPQQIHRLCVKEQYDVEMDMSLPGSPLFLAKKTIHYVSSCILSGEPCLSGTPHKLLAVLLYPIGRAFNEYVKWRGRRT